MKLIWKFNLVLLGIFILGFLTAGYVSHSALQDNAREEILQNARLMMEVGAVLAQLHGDADQAASRFADALQVPAADGAAYAATEQFNDLRKKHPDYTYKEATLNPTNLRDRATDWEADVINVFRASATTTELVGERDTPLGPALYLVAADPDQERRLPRVPQHRGRRAQDDDRPVRQRQRLRLAHGRDHRRADRVGAHDLPIARANRAFKTFMGSLAVVFVAIFVLLNVMLYTMVIRRVTALAGIADQVSLGNMDAGEFKSRSRDEIGVLTDAMGRMKASLVQAMKMLGA